jgi:Fe-S-cluster-containing dehydrogenase component
MGKIFTVDVARCNGCTNCQLACKDEHVDNDWMPYAKPQPEIGQFWLKLEEHVRGSRPKVRIHYVPRLCNHCERPACVAACSKGAISKRGEDGFVLIQPEGCDGCGDCMRACPYGVIYHNDVLGICQKCTGCAHLLDHGYELPRCVEACPTGALGWGDAEALQDFTCGAGVLLPEEGTKPQVFYRNIPGLFIAGTVYDPVEKEVVIGARCRLSNGGKNWEAVTDNYGDFWFTDLPKGKFELVIGAQGFAYRSFPEVDATQKDVNLGDIPLSRS